MVIEDKNNETETVINVRDSLTSKEGCVLLGADYSQIEFRLLAHLCKDEKLKEFFFKGQDIHYLVASHPLGKNIEDVTPQERNSFKQIVFGILYGMGAASVASILKISKQKAEEFIESFLGKFANVNKFISDTQQYAARNGQVHTLLGRRRLIKGHGDDKGLADRRAVNSVVQGSAADIIKLAMIKIDESLLQDRETYEGCVLVLQIHDELVYEVPIEKLEVMKVLVKESMENIYQLIVPLKVSMETGLQWGSMERIVD
jgi:DNA polymerase-1